MLFRDRVVDESNPEDFRFSPGDSVVYEGMTVYVLTEVGIRWCRGYILGDPNGRVYMLRKTRESMRRAKDGEINENNKLKTMGVIDPNENSVPKVKQKAKIPFGTVMPPVI